MVAVDIAGLAIRKTATVEFLVLAVKSKQKKHAEHAKSKNECHTTAPGGFAARAAACAA
uniref:Uncharacterized protein n=1 Tax=Setaria digitata TaxID=48799 RepID=A0A915PQ46_9BILA